ncbi:hypothetical protein U3516DRAFT_838978 [Neocallimastix sp. 'constans']
MEKPLEVLTKNSRITGTCFGKDFPTMIDGIYIQFKDTFFFSYIIQFILVLLLFSNVGSGPYWKILFYASLSGLIGSLFENITLAYICQESQRENHGKVVPFLLSEIFWVITEYSIPYLNLIKMKTLSREDSSKRIKYIIYFLSVPFVVMRICIGCSRMIKGYLDDQTIEVFHGIAFGIMAISEVVCSIYILHFIAKYNKRVTLNPSFFVKYFQHSSYNILIAVDIVSILLSLLYIYVNLVNSNGIILTRASVIPFHSFKSVFILILAIDACLFKYGANVGSSINGTSEYNLTVKGAGTNNTFDISIKSNNYKNLFYSSLDSPSNLHPSSTLNNILYENKNLTHSLSSSNSISDMKYPNKYININS